MELISLIVVVVISLFTLVYLYFRHAFTYWRSRNIPHDDPIFPYGNVKGFQQTIHQSEFMKNLYDKYKPSGAKFCGFYLLAGAGAVLLDLQLVKDVLVKDFAYFDERGFYYNEEDDPMSSHLFTMEGERWRLLRAKLTPTFTSGKMKFMFPTVVEVGRRFRDCLFDIVKENDEFEIRDILARFTTDVIGTTAFGIECNTLKEPNAEFRKHGNAAMEKLRYHPFIILMLAGFRNTGRKLHMKILPDDVSEFFLKVVRDTVEYREKNNIQRNDFMDILIKLKNQETSDKEKVLTLNEVAAQAFVFFLAGFETSSTTLAYCLYELAVNQEIQNKTRQVIRDAFQRHGGKFTYEMMVDMPYIDRVLHETLRKYPPLPNLNRKTKKDYQVRGSMDVIERGTSIIIPIYAIQRDPELYPEPERFDPDRFDGEAAKGRDAMAWLPFGDGPRNCIGVRFGMMQARIGLVTLLNNFQVSLGAETPVPLVFDPKPFLLTPKGGIFLKFKRISVEGGGVVGDL